MAAAAASQMGVLVRPSFTTAQSLHRSLKCDYLTSSSRCLVSSSSCVYMVGANGQSLCPGFKFFSSNSHCLPTQEILGGSHDRERHSRKQRSRQFALQAALREGEAADSAPEGRARGSEAADDWNEDDEEWDEEELDELFEEFGETVMETESEGTRRTKEAQDDEESCAFAVAMARVAAEGKGSDIRVLHVKSLVYWARCFVIVTAFSRPQVDAIGQRVQDAAEIDFERLPTGGDRGGGNSWTLLDYGDVVVHIFLPATRAFYNLEEFYGNASYIDLPLSQQ
eukprot:TRINITY_DN689_c1_g3_i1.p1 TRINITY_DN689_c1_g3~~TRINITY_DN689_c1_g3_i1.p1  ORF type:complete len:282 (+),score=47.48 TRINITY_DN689_c1_g3_i1:100-945(+)